MSELAQSDAIFFTQAGLDRAKLERQVDAALAGVDDGELYLEHRQSESLVFDDGKLKSASFDATQGFGLRAVAGEAAAYAHSTELSHAAVARAAETVAAVRTGRSASLAPQPEGTNRQLYGDLSPLSTMPFA